MEPMVKQSLQKLDALHSRLEGSRVFVDGMLNDLDILRRQTRALSDRTQTWDQAVYNASNKGDSIFASLQRNRNDLASMVRVIKQHGSGDILKRTLLNLKDIETRERKRYGEYETVIENLRVIHVASFLTRSQLEAIRTMLKNLRYHQGS